MAPLLACGVAEEEHRAVVRQRDSLATALDELKFGAPRMLAATEAALSAGHLEAARDTARQLVERHAATPEGKTGARLLADAEGRISARDSAAAKARRDSVAAADRARREAGAAAEAQQRRAVASLERQRDDVRSATYYYPRWAGEARNRRSAVLLYIVKPDNESPRLRFEVRYRGDDWLFIQSYIVKTDKQTMTLGPFGHDAIERDNGYGGVWEWYSTTADHGERAFVAAILSSTKAVLRYNGRQYYHDRTIGAEERADLRRVLDAYTALGGT